jgi:MIZ/SP-RING zinc finger
MPPSPDPNLSQTERIEFTALSSYFTAAANIQPAPVTATAALRSRLQPTSSPSPTSVSNALCVHPSVFNDYNDKFASLLRPLSSPLPLSSGSHTAIFTAHDVACGAAPVVDFASPHVPAEAGAEVHIRLLRVSGRHNGQRVPVPVAWPPRWVASTNGRCPHSGCGVGATFLTPFLQRRSGARNAVRIHMPGDSNVGASQDRCCEYVAYVQVVSRRSAEEIAGGVVRQSDLLWSMLRQRDAPGDTMLQYAQADARQWFTSSVARDGVEIASVVLSLRCPLSQARINVAARGRCCAHLGCFDLDSFLRLLISVGAEACPLCGQALALEDLIVSKLVQHAVVAYEDADDVVVLASGSFGGHATDGVRAQRVNENCGINTGSGGDDIVDLCSPEIVDLTLP